MNSRVYVPSVAVNGILYLKDVMYNVLMYYW
jgi:hypothetical protein